MKLDSFLIERAAEPAAGWVMDRYGISHFRIAAELFGLSIVSLGVWVLAIMRDGFGKGIVIALLIVPMAVWINSWRRDEAYDSDRRTMNALAISEAPRRQIDLVSASIVATLIVTISFDVRDAIFCIYMVAEISAMYFRACQGRPPRRRQRALVPAFGDAR